MEITKHNFIEKLDDIAEAISEASFLAIDGEFTGLDKPGCSHVEPFDTLEERYAKLREGSLDFLLVQFGLCTFKFKEETQSYEAKAFNFYIFPRPYTRQAPDRRFLCQSSSIDFLVQQGFDFNKLFREGIPYLTPLQEEGMREALNLKHQAFSKFSSPAFFSPDQRDMGPGKGPIQIPEEQKEFMANACEKISQFIDNSTEESLQLDPCNAFQRKLIYQTIRTKFSSVHLETKTGERKERFIVVTKVTSDEELKKKEKDKQNAELMELEEAVGFSKVITLLAQSRKTVVGHNMTLDLMHLFNQFLYPLPQELDEFKDMVMNCFPRVIDTKFMANSHPLREVISNSALGNMQEILQRDPFVPAKVELPDEFGRYKDSTARYHEAGYDAFVTGSMFATMANYLGRKEQNSKTVVEPSSRLLDPFLNKLHQMRIADTPYMNLAGPDLQPSRDHVFHLTFPREWKATEINGLFGAFGNIQISWINETSAFVSLYRKDNADAVLKALGETRTLYRLVPYKVFKRSVTTSPPNNSTTTTAPIPLDDPLPTSSSSTASAAATPRPSVLSTSTPTPVKKRPPLIAPGSLKRPLVDSDNGKEEEGEEESLKSASKKLCSADAGGTTGAVMADDTIPEKVPRSQLDNKSTTGQTAEADSTQMFAVPSDW